MDRHDRHDSHTPAWTVFTTVPFAAGTTMAPPGVRALPPGPCACCAMEIDAVFLPHTSILPTRTLPDRHAARIVAERCR